MPEYCCDTHTPWRVGRKVGRTIYVQPGLEPADTDKLIGMMDTPELAAEAVNSHNRIAKLSTVNRERAIAAVEEVYDEVCADELILPSADLVVDAALAVLLTGV